MSVTSCVLDLTNGVEVDSFSLFVRIYCSMIGSTDEDVLVLEESDDNVHVNLRHTKDFRFVIVNTFSTTSSKVNALRETKGLLELIY